MESIDLKILESPPELSIKAKLIIEPLAPLSMVSDLPGSFYKSLKSPSKKMLCGLFENLLGWHIDIADRKEIQKHLISVRQKAIKDKEEKKAVKAQIESNQQGSTYIPLLMEYFEIDLVTLPPMLHYNDLWSRSFSRRNDSAKHAAGSMFMDSSFMEKWRIITTRIKEDKKRESAKKNTLLDNLFKRYKEYFPLYYTTPTSREFIHMNVATEINVSINSDLYDLLKISAVKNNCLYLGNSEGWINFKIDKL